LDSRGGGTRWRMAAKKWTLPQYCEGKTSAWHLRATVWPDRVLEETTKLAEVGVVGGGRRRCFADVFVRWSSFWLRRPRATLLLLDETLGGLGSKSVLSDLVDVVRQMDGLRQLFEY